MDQLNAHGQENKQKFVHKQVEDLKLERHLDRNMIKDEALPKQEHTGLNPLPSNEPVDLPKSVIPRKLLESLSPILAWKKVKDESSKPLQDAARALLKAKTEAASGEALEDLTRYTIQYLNLRGGFKKTRSGAQRRDAVMNVAREILAYLPCASASNMEHMQNVVFTLADGKYDRAFREGVRRAFNTNNEEFALNEALAQARENAESKKRLIRSWGGMQALAQSMLDQRKNPGLAQSYNVAMDEKNLSVAELDKTLKNMKLPDIKAMDDVQLLSTIHLESLRKSVYLPLLMNFNRLIREGELDDLRRIADMRSKFAALEAEIELYDLRLKKIAGTITKDEEASYRAKEKYADEIEADTKQEEREKLLDYLREYKREYARANRGRKLSADDTVAGVLRVEKLRAKREYLAMKEAQDLEQQRIAKLTAAKMKAKHETRVSEPVEYANLMKLVKKSEREKDVSKNREMRSPAAMEMRKKELAQKKEQMRAAIAKREKMLADALLPFENAAEKKISAADYKKARKGLVSMLAKLAGGKEEAYADLTIDRLIAITRDAKQSVDSEEELENFVSTSLKSAVKAVNQKSIDEGIAKYSDKKNQDPLRTFALKEYSLLGLERKIAPYAKGLKNRNYNREDLEFLTSEKIQSLTKDLSVLYGKSLDQANQETLPVIHRACVDLLEIVTGAGKAELIHFPTEKLIPMVEEVIGQLITDSKSLKKNQKTWAETINAQEEALADDDFSETILALQKEIRRASGKGENTEMLSLKLRQYCTCALYHYVDIGEVDWTGYDRYTDDELVDFVMATIFADSTEDNAPDEEYAEGGTYAVSILTKMSGRDASEFNHIPKSDLMLLSLDAIEHLHKDSNEQAEAVRNVLSEYEAKNSSGALRKKIADAKAATEVEGTKEQHDVAMRRVRELSIYTLCRNGEMRAEDLASVPTRMVLHMAEKKLSGELDAGTQESMEGFLTMQTQREEYAYKKKETEKRKEELKKSRSKTAWTKEGEHTLRLFGDLVSGETLYDEKGREIPEKDRIRKILASDTVLLAKLAKGRKDEIAGKLSGPMQELLSNVYKEEGALIRAVKDVLDAFLDRLNEGSKKDLTAGEIKKLLSDKDVDAMVGQMDEKIMQALTHRSDKVEDVMEIITSDIYDDQTTEIKPINADTLYVQFLNQVNNSYEITEKMRIDGALEAYEKAGVFSKEQIEAMRKGKIPSKMKKEIMDIASKPEALEVLETSDPVLKRLDKLVMKPFDEWYAAEEEEVESPKEKLKKIRLKAFSDEMTNGRFIKHLAKEYYKKSSSETKRKMLSGLLRDIRPKANYVDDSHGTKRSGRYFASMMKGAGPMMQKILQGIPEASVTIELTPVLQTVKSNLGDIPHSYVQMKMKEIIKANPEVTDIKVERSLGAASVAQTFLCTFTMKDGKTKSEVVKLLRPNIEKQFEDESKVILACAKEADPTGVIEAGYRVQLKNVSKELDFRNEAANCKKGKVYKVSSKKEGTIKTVKVDDKVATTKDYMVMNKAEGVTVDQYIEELRRLEQKVLSRFATDKDAQNDGVPFAVTHENFGELSKSREEIIKKIEEAEKRQLHVARLAKQWVSQALFGTYFHHGDLHAGNIMINDEYATVLDYGNATQMTQEQMNQIVRMMAGALTGKVNLFIRDLENLLSMHRETVIGAKGKPEQVPAPIKVTSKQKEDLKVKLEKLFEMGGAEETGDRIFVALLMAQEVGITIPPELQSFSTCEQRLDNTLTELNDQILNLRKLVRKIDALAPNIKGTNTADALLYVQKELSNTTENSDLKKKMDEEVKLHTVVEEVDETKLKNDLSSLKKNVFERKYLGSSFGIQMENVERQQKELPIPQLAAKAREVFGQIRQAIDTGKTVPKELESTKKNQIHKVISDLILGAMTEDPLFGGSEEIVRLLGHAFHDYVVSDFERVMDILERRLPLYIELNKRLNDYRAVAGKLIKKTSAKLAREKVIEQYKLVFEDRQMSTQTLPYLQDRIGIPRDYELVKTEDASADVSRRIKKNESLGVGKTADILRKAYDAYAAYEHVHGLRGDERAKKNMAIRNFLHAYEYAGTVTLVQERRKKIEQELAPYFKENKPLAETFRKYQKLQDRWLDARYEKSADQEKIRVEMKKTELDFVILYKKMVLPMIEKRRDDFKQDVSQKYLNGFIDEMEDTFTIGRMFDVFGFKAKEYLPNGEDLPDEYVQMLEGKKKE